MQVRVQNKGKSVWKSRYDRDVSVMFYYVLDFHDLAPDSFLHISAFITTCEAFHRISPHFALWLKTFNVKPKVMDGKQVECGGASISKLINSTWPKGSFTESSNLWQREWVTSPSPVVQGG